MKLLINDSQLQLIPSLAMQVGLNGAILLQQLYFRSLIFLKEYLMGLSEFTRRMTSGEIRNSYSGLS